MSQRQDQVAPVSLPGRSDSLVCPPALRSLDGEESPAADAALVDALPDLDADVAAAAFAMLIKRAHLPSLSTLAGRFTTFGAGLQALILEHVDELFAAVRGAIESDRFEDRAAAIEIISRSGCFGLVYLLATAVRSRCPKTRDLAAQALHTLTARFLRHRRSNPTTEEASTIDQQAGFLADALREAIVGWELHFRSEVLEAGMWMADRLEPTFREKLQEPRTRMAHMLNGLIERSSDPRMAGFLLRALAMPDLRSAAARTISEAKDAALRRALVIESQLLDEPEIERGFRRIRDCQWLNDSVDALLQAGKGQADNAVRIAMATGGTRHEKIRCLQALIGAGEDEFTQAVVKHLRQDKSDASTDLLRLVASRAGDGVAETPDRELRRPTGGVSEGSAVDDLGQEAAGGRIGEPQLGNDEKRTSFEQLWGRFEHLSTRERDAYLRLFEHDREELLVPIRAQLASNNCADRGQALRLVRAMGQARAVEEQVYKLSHDPDAVVRSLAIGMLAELPGPTGRRILRAAMMDPDERVQANAVEVLDLLNVPDRLADTEPKLESPNNRVRANAVKSLLRMEFRKSGDVLLNMLDDPSSAQRISALWVIERLELASVVSRVTTMSRHDPDLRVRRRAQRVLHEFLGEHAAQRTPPYQGGVGGLASRAGADQPEKAHASRI